MESVGRLAGGIAHDMNNLLSPIIGYSQMLQRTLDEGSKTRKYIDSIYQAGKSAKKLISQLLAFSRKQTLKLEYFNLNQVLQDFKGLLDKTTRDNIKLKYELTDNQLQIKSDKGQIEQVLMNLVINAADAMPEGGSIVIETKIINIDEDYLATYKDLDEGQYALLSITDTGYGMDRETQKNIFEPFFSTKG